MPRTSSDTRFLSTRYAETGTKFRIYPQPKWLKGFRLAKVVYLNSTPGTIKPGPRDKRIYVIDAINKRAYVESGGRPPYRGPHNQGVRPNARGHFTDVQPGTRKFSAAMAFATVRCVLEIWEFYFGRKLPWYFRKDYSHLELIPLVLTNNAWSQYGYIECGFQDLEVRHPKPYAENFDVVAHETGHCIIHGVIGEPPRPKPVQYRALDEGLADLIATVSSLHFEPVVEHVLQRTRGNLFSDNVLSRIGELSGSAQIRKVFNGERMSTVKWDPIEDRYKYALSAPFTGGAFDILVEIYQQQLIRRGAISKDLADRSYDAVHQEVSGIQREFSREFRGKPEIFKDALLEARDYFGRLLARTLDRTTMGDPSYPTVVANMLEADAQLSGGEYRQIVRGSFLWREILPAAADR